MKTLTMAGASAALALACCLAAAVPCRGALAYHELGRMADTVAVADSMRPSDPAWAVEMRAAPAPARPREGLSANSWALVFGRERGRLWTARVRGLTRDFGTEHEQRRSVVTVSLGDSVAWQGEFDKEFAHDGYNTLTATYLPGQAAVALAGGRDGDTPLTSVAMRGLPLAGAAALGEATVATLVADTDAAPAFHPRQADLSKPGTRHWRYLDRDTDPAYARLGGQYALATVPDGRGGYDVAYMGGAQVLPALWRPGVCKGHMAPSPAGGYDLEWLDAQGRDMGPEASAVLTGNMLTLLFPLYRSSLRFVEVEPPQGEP